MNLQHLSDRPTNVRLLSVVLAVLACQGGQESDGCVQDTDCKGDRICEDRQCVSPAESDDPSRSDGTDSEGSGDGTEDAGTDAGDDAVDDTASSNEEPPHAAEADPAESTEVDPANSASDDGSDAAVITPVDVDGQEIADDTTAEGTAEDVPSPFAGNWTGVWDPAGEYGLSFKVSAVGVLEDITITDSSSGCGGSGMVEALERGSWAVGQDGSFAVTVSGCGPGVVCFSEQIRGTLSTNGTAEGSIVPYGSCSLACISSAVSGAATPWTGARDCSIRPTSGASATRFCSAEGEVHDEQTVVVDDNGNGGVSCTVTPPDSEEDSPPPVVEAGDLDECLVLDSGALADFSEIDPESYAWEGFGGLSGSVSLVGLETDALTVVEGRLEVTGPLDDSIGGLGLVILVLNQCVDASMLQGITLTVGGDIGAGSSINVNVNTYSTLPVSSGGLCSGDFGDGCTAPYAGFELSAEAQTHAFTWDELVGEPGPTDPTGITAIVVTVYNPDAAPSIDLVIDDVGFW